MTTFSDLLKESILTSQTIGGLSVEGVILSMAMSFLAGWVIYQVYRSSFTGVMYINQFAISLVGLTMITNLIILTITSNLLLSLGMVGALSIVRFRTAVKEPIDMIYMFWAIATGIAIGAGFFLLVAIGLVLIGAALFFLSRFTSQNDLFILVIDYDQQEARAEIEAAVHIHANHYRLRAEVAVRDHRELTMEIRLKRKSSGVLSVVESIPGVSKASLIGIHTNQLY